MGPYAFLPFIVFARLARKLEMGLTELSEMIFGTIEFEDRLQYPCVGFPLTKPQLEAVDEVAKDLASFYVFDFGDKGFIVDTANAGQAAGVEGEDLVVFIPATKEEAEEIFFGHEENVPKEAVENLRSTTYELCLTEERMQALISAFKGGES